MAEYRGYNIYGDDTFGMKLIKTIGRGSLPNALKGSFTTEQFAQIAIDSVLAEKGEKDGTSAEVRTS